MVFSFAAVLATADWFWVISLRGAVARGRVSGSAAGRVVDTGSHVPRSWAQRTVRG